MKQAWIGALALLLFCTSARASAPQFNPTQPDNARNMATFGVTSMPVGYYEYCGRYRDRCARGPGGTMIELTRSAWSDIGSVIAKVKTIKPLTDIEM